MYCILFMHLSIYLLEMFHKIMGGGGKMYIYKKSSSKFFTKKATLPARGIYIYIYVCTVLSVNEYTPFEK